jgi:hypothetical protein
MGIHCDICKGPHLTFNHGRGGAANRNLVRGNNGRTSIGNAGPKKGGC